MRARIQPKPAIPVMTSLLLLLSYPQYCFRPGSYCVKKLPLLRHPTVRYIAMKTTGRTKKAAKRKRSPSGKRPVVSPDVHRDRTARQGIARCRRVGILLPSDYAFTRQVRVGIAHYAAAHGPWTFSTQDWQAFEPISILDRWDGDGIITLAPDENFVRDIRASGIAAVSVTAGTSFPTVTMDNAAVGRLAAEHLIKQGHRHFGYVGINSVYSRQRQAAFARTIRQAGLQETVYEPVPCERVPWKWQVLQRLLVPWLRSLPKPVGVMACSDYRGRHIIEAAHDCGAIVPDQVAVVGTANDEVICGFCDPPLSSVSIAGERIGYEAARLLDRLMKGGPAPAKPILIPPGGVVVRRSSDMLALADADVAAALRFIRAHGNKSLGVADVLAEVPISRRRLERRFRSVIGHTPWREIRLAQIAHVKKVLAETDMIISSVAAASAFSNARRLCTIFKAEVGMTPGAYRRQFRTV